MLNTDLVVGQRLTRSGPPLSLKAFSTFGKLLGTDAPIHNDPEYAAKTPFGEVIAQGPLLLAPFESWLCEMFGAERWSVSGRIQGKFVSPAKAGDTTTLELVVQSIVSGRATFDLKVTCGERLLAVGEASIGNNN